MGPAALRRITRDYAARSDLWTPLLRYGTDHHWSMQVHADDDVDIWLITWLQKQSTSLHDHGGSAGAFTAVSRQGPGVSGFRSRVRRRGRIHP